ncbi:hypothetical protein AB0N05_20610 [Nocardia sp. NPDC051030]|uniref:hypothetical protein n=1 Tax=Nocardia sp. NPDC051030 TaxID=3155162 RepID=UPI00341A131A
MSPTDDERLARSAAYDHYFQLARDWDLETAEAAHIRLDNEFLSERALPPDE